MKSINTNFRFKREFYLGIKEVASERNYAHALGRRRVH